MLLDYLYAIPPWAYIAVIMPMFVVLPTVGLLTLLERKVASWTQDRIGPNRAGYKLPFLENVPKIFRKPLMLLQVGADGLKFFTKEDYRAKNVDKVLFTIAPAIMIVIVFAAIAVVPWAGTKGDRSVIHVAAGETPRAAIDADIGQYRHHILAGARFADAEKDAPDLKPTELDTPVTAARDLVYLHGWKAQIASMDIGILFSVAVLSLAVYGVVIGGWASNNKYSFLGGLRACANMVSYEIPLGISILTIVVLFGTLDLSALVERQTHYWLGFIPAWNVFSMPAVFLIFLTCLHAESNRAPFDIAEAEQELVGGYHTEYSSMRFALFFLAEYFEMMVTSCICVALFFGGWHVPYVDKIWPALGGGIDPSHPALTSSWLVLLVRWAVFYGKALVIILVFMWTRWSLPRFRFDQILGIAWQGLVPMSLALFVVSALTVWAFGGYPRIDGGILPFRMGAAILAGNIAVLAATVIIARLARGPVTKVPNKRIPIAGSRFTRSPLPAGVVPTNAL
jgi:NADH-quinone oxidoreductase subunit H